MFEAAAELSLLPLLVLLSLQLRVLRSRRDEEAVVTRAAVGS